MDYNGFIKRTKWGISDETNSESPLLPLLQKVYGKTTGCALESGGEDGHEACTDLSLQGPVLQNYDGIVWGLGETNCAHAVDDWIGVESIQDTPKILAGIGVGALGLFEGPRRR